MYSPCSNCLNRYGHSYTEECDNTCDYAYQLSKLKPYGGIDEAVKVMKGEAIPVALLKKENIDWTYAIVRNIKDMLTEQDKTDC